MTPTSEKAATPMAFVRAIVQAYEQAGVSPAAALAKAQIRPSRLDLAGARITASQMETLSGAAMRELDDEALGWFDRRLPYGTYGMLCRASLSSPSLGIALKRWCRHHALLTDCIGLSLDVRDGRATVRITERRPLGTLREFCLVSSFRYLHGFACWAIDSRIPFERVAFTFAAPPHRDVYPLLFPGPATFEADVNAVTFDAHYLALPLRRDEAALQAMLQRALPLTVRLYRRDRMLVHRTRALLRQDPARPATAPDVAEALNVSVRTLHRQLQTEGASLQGLKDEVRRDTALHLLRRTPMPLKQVAAQVGYSDEKTFSRAFVQWTGRTPGAVRKGEGTG